ncbi:MAG TPA: hypothetical protein ENJ27_01895 [Candidatus Moranbacteria bacterium]|nr:hypothetical protein [Candidatus Moranbacteria bacterium]
MLTKNMLIEDFINLGLSEADTVLIRGNLGKIGRLKKRDLFLEALFDVIGEEGTIVTLGFTKSFPFYRVNKNYVYTEKTLPETGALGKLFLKNKKHYRSSHPTNSFIALGKHAKYITEDHDEKSLSYDPMKKIIELDAKMIIFGIIEDSPGFTTVHYAQQELGLTKKSFFKKLFRVFYLDKNGNKKIFKKSDIGGCSNGFGKFYQYYISNGILKIGNIGNSKAILSGAKDSYDIEYKLIEKNHSYFFCDNPLCVSCRVSWKYDFKYLPTFIILKLIDRLKKIKN